MPTFGKSPAHYVEIEDPDNPGQAKRPDAGYEVPVRDAITLTALDDWVTEDLGYPVGRLYTTAAGIHAIDLDPNKDGTWVYQLYSAERDIAVALELPDLDTILGSATAAATSAAASATTSASSATSAQQAANDAAQTKENVAAITIGPTGPAGDPGSAGLTGATLMQCEFSDNPQAGTVSNPIYLTHPAVLMPKVGMVLTQGNTTTTPYKLTILQDGVDLLTSLGKNPTCAVGESQNFQTLASAIDIPLGVGGLTKLEMQVTQRGPDGTGSATPPVIRAYTAYASGVSSAPVTLNSGMGFAATLTLPTFVVGDELRMSIQSNVTPSSVASGTGSWTQVGTPIVDTNTFAVQTTWRKAAVTGEASPVVTFTANAGMAAVIASYYTADAVAPVDGVSTAVQNTSNATGTTAALAATTAAAEAALITVGTRFASSGAPTSLVSAPSDGSLTKLAEALTVRGSTSPNFGITLFYKAMPTLGGTVAAKSVPLTTTTGTPAPVAWWYMRSTALKGAAADNPGVHPVGFFTLVVDTSADMP